MSGKSRDIGADFCALSEISEQSRSNFTVEKFRTFWILNLFIYLII